MRGRWPLDYLLLNLPAIRAVLRLRGPQFVVERPAPGLLHTDGETRLAGWSITFSIRPAGLRILAPKPTVSPGASGSSPSGRQPEFVARHRPIAATLFRGIERAVGGADQLLDMLCIRRQHRDPRAHRERQHPSHPQSRRAAMPPPPRSSWPFRVLRDDLTVPAPRRILHRRNGRSDPPNAPKSTGALQLGATPRRRPDGRRCHSPDLKCVHIHHHQSQRMPESWARSDSSVKMRSNSRRFSVPVS